MLGSRRLDGPPPEGSDSPFSCSANMISTENKEVKNFHTHGLLIATNQKIWVGLPSFPDGSTKLARARARVTCEP